LLRKQDVAIFQRRSVTIGERIRLPSSRTPMLTGFVFTERAAAILPAQVRVCSVDRACLPDPFAAFEIPAIAGELL
jgi:hypothetical protein